MDGLLLDSRAQSEPLAAGRGLVTRGRLFRRLSDLPPGGVMLVQGPAGSGKTVLVRSWAEVEGFGDRVAWVSVERAERDAQRFWPSLFEELASTAGREELVARAGPSSDLRGQVKRLLSALRSLEEPLVLVIDDLHELACPDAAERLELLLSSLPPSLQAVLLTA